MPSFYENPDLCLQNPWNKPPATDFFHEMKNILAVLKGFLQILALNPKYMEDLPKLDLMNRETDHLYQMAMEYLGLARAAATCECLEADDLVKEVQEMLKADAQAAGVHIQTQLTPGVKIKGKALEVRQLVLNLAKNGIEAMKEGGTLSLEVSTEAGRPVLQVRDQGPGIPEEICRHFGAYTQSHKPHGSGSGLPFCRRVIEECGAEWQIQTSPQGSCIRVLFPVPDTPLSPPTNCQIPKSVVQ